MAETTLEIIQGLSQAASNAYDGGHDERFTLDGQVRNVGLKREEGDPIVDSRVIDGFKVKFMGNRLCVNYQSELQLKEVHGGNFESDIEQTFSDIAKFLRKEYKAVTGNGLTLTADGEADIMVQNTSRHRTWVQAYKVYKIGGIGDVEEVGASTPDERLSSAVKSWLAIGKESYPGSKKPSNVTRKNGD